uniref:Uncharacterized protein n=1 Tax=Ascaris lumbricoides TaxID=6252 RepID=A0A0M3HVG6_ASCLU
MQFQFQYLFLFLSHISLLSPLQSANTKINYKIYKYSFPLQPICSHKVNHQ